MDHLSWDYLRTFLAVMEHGSLSAAARALGITQPTAGRHVALLEESTGQALFLRSSGGLLPTEQAEALLPHARSMAFAASAAARTLSGLAGKVEGTVRISASEVVGVEILPSIIAGLQEEHPGLEIELSASDAVEDLLQREADIAVRMAEPQQEALLVRFIGNITLGFHASEDYISRHGAPETLGDLKDHRLVGFDRQTAYIRAMAHRLPDMASVHFHFRADSNLAQLSAIRAGCGIGLCQTGLAERPPALTRLLPDFALPLPTWIAMHEDLRNSPRCYIVFQALAKGLKRLVDNRRAGG
ncbi:LysR family transcriptional regulator [Gellertiella hungarica]|uniref:DNA-binding transcriptional LysR family regulator n=1 Tax=Gellertiella hungarica TaxID=1572859 RepID=A0A7W6NJF4_9HYPH|nr:LysR family transcriptional regulator [Gellertiella hungarica]MBB4063429.1 DNA-binding transcriptional LysR family regulator [Gellertiella hungarica]